MNKKKPINRIKTILADKGRTNKWLAKQLNITSTSVSRWCTNEMQPSLGTLVKIAKVLDVNICELLYDTKEK